MPVLPTDYADPRLIKFEGMGDSLEDQKRKLLQTLAEGGSNAVENFQANIAQTDTPAQQAQVGVYDPRFAQAYSDVNTKRQEDVSVWFDQIKAAGENLKIQAENERLRLQAEAEVEFALRKQAFEQEMALLEAELARGVGGSGGRSGGGGGGVSPLDPSPPALEYGSDLAGIPPNMSLVDGIQMLGLDRSVLAGLQNSSEVDVIFRMDAAGSDPSDISAAIQNSNLRTTDRRILLAGFAAQRGQLDPRTVAQLQLVRSTPRAPESPFTPTQQALINRETSDRESNAKPSLATPEITYTTEGIPEFPGGF